MEMRMKKSLLAGAVLGIVCVIGAYVRNNFSVDMYFVLGLWYNRVIIGLVIGAQTKIVNQKQAMLRGAILGLAVSLAFFITTGFVDPISFIAGIVYGVIIEYWLSK